MYKFLSCMVVAGDAVKLQSALWSRILSRNNAPVGARTDSKRKKSITIVPQPAVAHANEIPRGDDADDIDDDDTCVICQGSLSREPQQFSTDDTDAEGQIDCRCCCHRVEVRVVRPLPESVDVDEWNVKLPCDHVFHRKCISKWWQVKQSCPLCNQPGPDPLHYETVICKRSCYRY